MPLQHLPNWFQGAVFLLALNAGMVNVLSLITVLHQSISHMTGNVSVMAMDLLSGNYSHVGYLLCVLLFYVLGSFYSGLILGADQFALNRRYGTPLSLVALFIFISWLVLPYFPRYGLLWACAAMGMQNAMISYYRGAIIRTTHLSGVLTDIGLALGYKARGLSLDSRRLVLHVLIILGFLLGGCVAAWVYPMLNINTFLLPVCLSLLLSVSYWLLYLGYTARQ